MQAYRKHRHSRFLKFQSNSGNHHVEGDGMSNTADDTMFTRRHFVKERSRD